MIKTILGAASAQEDDEQACGCGCACQNQSYDYAIGLLEGYRYEIKFM